MEEQCESHLFRRTCKRALLIMLAESKAESLPNIVNQYRSILQGRVLYRFRPTTLEVTAVDAFAKCIHFPNLLIKGCGVCRGITFLCPPNFPGCRTYPIFVYYLDRSGSASSRSRGSNGVTNTSELRRLSESELFGFVRDTGRPFRRIREFSRIVPILVGY